ncbi:MAG: alkaline phosphatase family protein, partial [Candidatus Aminicenantes bacterium RBG_16_66_30]
MMDTPRFPSRAFRAAVICLVTLAFVFLAGGCGNSTKSTRPPKGRVLVIGLDGLEWSLLRPMMDRGEAPNLKKLADSGVWGNFRSLEPLQKSPAIWTTLATGKSPKEHGIRGYVDMQGGKPLTQNIRRVKAIWNILSSTDRTVGIVGWLMSWPAEEVNGFDVSDYVLYQAAQDQRLEKRTYPEELYDEIAPLNPDWRAMPVSKINEFLSKPLVESDSNLVRAARPIRWMITGDQAFADIALKLGKEEKPDFLAVYLRSSDTMGHLYWNYQDPAAYRADLTDPAIAPWFKDTMRLDYKWLDTQVGRLVKDLADDSTTVIVCSDHGFGGGGGGGVADHKLDGVIILAGAHIAKGEITGATVYDLTPTILALYGLPKADDMPGKVLWSAFDKSIRPDTFNKTIPT